MTEASTEIEVFAEDDTPRQLGGVFAVRSPVEMVEQATGVANVLKDIVRKAGLVKRIGDKEYLLVEAWTTLGTLVGCTARTEWTRPIDNGWEAAVEVVNANGLVIGRAEASCLRSERNWAKRDDYALRSMAQTRAMGKALRMPLGWIAVLAGYDATPADEMPATSDSTPTPSAPPAEPVKSTKEQRQRIAIKRKAIPGLTEEQYREALFNRYGVKSAVQLTEAQAEDLIGSLTEAAKQMGVENA